MRPAGKAGDRTRDRGGDDDPASGGFLQVGHASFHGEERALQIGGEHCVPLLGRHVLDPRLRKDPGIGAEHVDAAIPPRRALFSNSAMLVTSAMASLASPPNSFAAAFASAWCRATIVTFAPFLAKTT